MKNLFLVGLVGLFSLTSVLDAEACHRRRCGGRHHRGGCGGCYVQPCYTNGGCQVYGGGYQQGGYGGGYVDPNMQGGGVGGAGAGVNVGPGGAGAGVNVGPGGAGAGAGAGGAGAAAGVNP